MAFFIDGVVLACQRIVFFFLYISGAANMKDLIKLLEVMNRGVEH